jgi:hypothetical protein
MGNLIANVFSWFWSKFIGWPREESNFTGILRTFLWGHILFYKDAFFENLLGHYWFSWFSIFAIGQFFLGLLQIVGMHSINGPFDFKLNRDLQEGMMSGRIKVIGKQDTSFQDEWKGLHRWFGVREHYMSGMTPTEKAKFFVETGGLTEETVKQLSQYPQTKRALQRLNYECQRPPKELVDFMRGKNIK